MIIILFVLLFVILFYLFKKKKTIEFLSNLASLIIAILIMLITIKGTNKDTLYLINQNRVNSQDQIINTKNEITSLINANWDATNKHLQLIKDIDTIKRKRCIELALEEMKQNQLLLEDLINRKEEFTGFKVMNNNKDTNAYTARMTITSSRFSTFGMETVLSNMAVIDKALLQQLLIQRKLFIDYNNILDSVTSSMLQGEPIDAKNNIDHLYRELNYYKFIKKDELILNMLNKALNEFKI